MTEFLSSSNTFNTSAYNFSSFVDKSNLNVDIIVGVSKCKLDSGRSVIFDDEDEDKYISIQEKAPVKYLLNNNSENSYELKY